VHPIFYLLLGVLGVLVFLVVAPLWSSVLAGLLVGYLALPTYRRLEPAIARIAPAERDRPDATGAGDREDEGRPA
jgi:predicted PurR-regulated permease PerM